MPARRDDGQHGGSPRPHRCRVRSFGLATASQNERRKLGTHGGCSGVWGHWRGRVRVEDGTTIIWMDGVKAFEQHDLPTATSNGEPFVIWGIALYGGATNPVGQVQLFKDVSVSSSLMEN